MTLAFDLLMDPLISCGSNLCSTSSLLSALLQQAHGSLATERLFTLSMTWAAHQMGLDIFFLFFLYRKEKATAMQPEQIHLPA